MKVHVIRIRRPRAKAGARWALAIVLLCVLLFVPQSYARSLPLSPRERAGEWEPGAWLATAEGAWAELLVVLHDQADPGELRALALHAPDRAAVSDHLWHAAQRSQGSLKAWLDRRGVTYRSFYIVNALLVQGDRALLQELARRPEVAYLLSNPRVPADLGPTTPQGFPQHLEEVTAIEWGVQRIGAPQVWALGYRGEGIVVAGQDTGYQWDHPALKAQYRGWDGVSVSHDYNWHDAIHTAGGTCPPDGAVPCDDNGHGTHTMGTIVGDDGASRQIGVAPGAQWIGCRNMLQGWGTPGSYIECFEFFLAPYPVGGNASQRDPSRAPHVINNSWSCPPSEGCVGEHIALLEQAVEAAQAAGILVVASAGNSGPACGSVSVPPGMYEATYTVGATDSSDVIVSFSSRGTGGGLVKPDITAPGAGVLSSLPGGGYGYKSGTSMASPHVVGAAALLWSARPDLIGEVTTTEYLLNTSAVTRTSTQCGDAPDAVPNSVYGWGRLDAYSAVRTTLEGSLVGAVRNLETEFLTGVTVQAVLGGIESLEAQTDASGAYILRPISGTYTVTASLAGYSSANYPVVQVTAGLTTTLDIVLTSQRTILLYLPLVFR
jgi:serine protease AprX